MSASGSRVLEYEAHLCRLIADNIAPRLVPNVELMTVDGKTLLVVEVFVSCSRPHWLKSEGAVGGVYVRLGSTNRQADVALVGELRPSAEGIAFDEMPMPELGTDDLDLDVARRLFDGISQLDPHAQRTLKLLIKYQERWVPTKGAVLLFGKERALHFSDAWVQCGRFVGGDKVLIFDHIDIHDPLPAAVDGVMLFLKKHAMRGAPIRVSFFDDRIEFESPGILLPGMTVDDMRQGVSKIHNHVIARVFRELNLIEQWGSGCKHLEFVTYQREVENEQARSTEAGAGHVNQSGKTR